MAKATDEFHWESYTEEYRNQLEGMKREGTQFFISQPVVKDGDKYVFKENLHNNWKQLYATVLRLQPASVYEAGCGGCYLLKNIHTLFPDRIKIAGSDLLATQLEYGKSFSDLPFSIISNLSVVNLTQNVAITDNYEFVFTHAVIMHLSTENARTFLRNLGKLSSKYIFMIEGVNNHEDWYGFVKATLPEFELTMQNDFIDNGILLTRKDKIPAPQPVLITEQSPSVQNLAKSNKKSFLVLHQLGRNDQSLTRNCVDVQYEPGVTAKQKYQVIKTALDKLVGVESNRNILGVYDLG